MGRQSIIINELPIVKRNHLHSQPVTSYGALSPITFTTQSVNLNIILTMLSAGPSVLLTGSVSAWRWLRCIISQHLNTTIRYLRDTTDRVICPYLTSPYLPHNKAANTMNVDQSNSLQTFCRNRRDIFPAHRSRLLCAEAPPEMRGRTRTQSIDHGSPRSPWCSPSWCCRPSGTATPTHRRC